LRLLLLLLLWLPRLLLRLRTNEYGWHDGHPGGQDEQDVLFHGEQRVSPRPSRIAKQTSALCWPVDTIGVAMTDPTAEVAAPSRTRDRLIDAAIVIVVLIVAVWLRFDRARADGLTFDEQWHMELSTGHGSPHVTLPLGVLIDHAPPVTSLRGAAPVPAVWSHLSGVAHPPLFIIVLRIWREVFGESDGPAKALSIVCSLVAIALLYDAVRTLHGRPAAMWAALLLAIAPAQIYLSQQVRGYAMAQMWACGALAAIARIDRLGVTRWRMVALAICATALPLTHYFGVIPDLALGAFVLIRFRGATRRRTFGALVVAGAIFLVSWGPFIREQQRTVSQMSNPWLREDVPAIRHALLTLGRAAAVPVRQIAEPAIWTLQWPVFAGAVLLIAPLIIMVVRRDRAMLLWIIWLLGTLGFVTVLDLARNTNQLTYTRYASLCAPAVCALIAALGMSVPRPLVLRHLLPLAAAGFALWPAPYTRDDEPEWRGLGEVMRQHMVPTDILVFASGAQVRWYHEILYLAAAHYDAGSFPRPIVRLGEPVSPELLTQLNGRSVWLISGPLDRPIEQLLPGAQLVEQYELRPIALFTHVTFPAAATTRTMSP
jgi:hypothetical protein